MVKKGYLSVFILLLLMSLLIGCKSKDKEVVLSNNVSKEVNKQDKAINENIELGNGYLKQSKYTDARKAYEKAIYKDKLNKQNYIQIKEKYMDKSRFDDAYYFVKLAIDNEVDIDNMKKILEEIKKSFPVINIENSVYQKDNYELPEKVSLKINGEDVQGDVKWDSSDINTKNIGTLTYQGKIEKYGRTVQLKLNVKQTTFNNGGLYVSYKGKVYFRKGTINPSDNTWEKGYYVYNPYIYFLEKENNIMCIGEDGKSNVVFNDKGWGNIYIYNDKMYLQECIEDNGNIYVVNLDGTNRQEIAQGEIKGIDEENGVLVYERHDSATMTRKLTKLNVNTGESEEYKLSEPYDNLLQIKDGVIYYQGTVSTDEWTQGRVKLCSIGINGDNNKLLADFKKDFTGLKENGAGVVRYLQFDGNTIYFSYGKYYGLESEKLGGQIAKVNKDGSDFKILVGDNNEIQDNNACMAMDKFYVSNADGSNKLYYTSAIDRNVNYALDLNTGQVNKTSFDIGEVDVPFESGSGVKVYLDSSAKVTTLIPKVDYSILKTDKKVDLYTINNIQICDDWVYYTLDANERYPQHDYMAGIVGYNRLESIVLRKQINGDKVEKLFEY